MMSVEYWEQRSSPYRAPDTFRPEQAHSATAKCHSWGPCHYRTVPLWLSHLPGPNVAEKRVSGPSMRNTLLSFLGETPTPSSFPGMLGEESRWQLVLRPFPSLPLVDSCIHLWLNCGFVINTKKESITGVRWWHCHLHYAVPGIHEHWILRFLRQGGSENVR